MPATDSLPRTLGELRRSSQYSEERLRGRTVKDEIRDNLICRLQRREPLFPGIVGYEETVAPQVINALLSRHNFILLGLRGQAKTKLIRMLIQLLDEHTPFIEGSEIRDNPYHPVSKYGRERIAELRDETPIDYLSREERYVEKLATPDVTIADMIGDIDPIKAARRGHNISDELTVHYGLLPRANRGIFAVNELPDLAGKIQVGLFNIMQEGDVQIKGYPVRLPLDVLLVFTANPEDYTARGKIITPLKDRIGSEIRTHYPVSVEHGIEITAQESWTRRTGPVEIEVPPYIREVIENIAFLARDDKRVDKRSGVSQRLPITVMENVISNAERRALRAGETFTTPRVVDIYAALPSITGKLELEYEGELKGGDAIARELIRTAVGKVYSTYFEGTNMNPVIKWFELGGNVRLDESVDAATMVQQFGSIQGLLERTGELGVTENEPDAVRAGAAEFILEGLYAHRRVARSEQFEFSAGERRRDERPDKNRERGNRDDDEDLFRKSKRHYQ